MSKLDADFYINFNFTDWYRYYYVIRNIIDERPKKILEIGIGNKIIQKCTHDLVDRYETMDVNPLLSPNIVNDIREHDEKLDEVFDYLICLECLEHIPFEDFNRSLQNTYAYLQRDGKMIISLPHRRITTVLISPRHYNIHTFTLPIWLLPRQLLLKIRKGKVWIDPNHQWEIGNDVSVNDVEKEFTSVGYKIEDVKKLMGIDMWTLRK